MEKGINEWAQTAAHCTKRASETKDWRLTRKADRRFKEIARELTEGKGYVIATEAELAERWPEVFPKSATFSDNRIFIWAVSFMETRNGNKMCFLPIR